MEHIGLENEPQVVELVLPALTAISPAMLLKAIDWCDRLRDLRWSSFCAGYLERWTV